MMSPMDSATAHRSAELSSFLRARRQAMTPQDAGLIPGTGRRVQGLRREELALLAGLSTDYYRRLEQGREHRPSLQVLRALARALRLDAHATTYLISLVHPAPLATPAHATTTASAGVQHLLNHGLRVPAFVLDLGLNILAINAAGRAMYSGFADITNLARMVFLDPAARDFYPNWHHVATQTVGNLRWGLTRFPSDDRVAEVVEEISPQSSVFTELWATHYVRPRPSEDKLFHHPQLGELHLHFEALEVADAPDQRLFVYCALDGGPSPDAVALLQALAESALSK
ncbi:helix-turn-helix transcriptional regulator [Mycolicibacterium sp. 050158]|uniref:helix-turn-helix domain-containing protein n=1 Tax=Mycolicibacterium sp. 050158 TaxID=3090602 RepID=UPI00299D683D|nr:helix-turn-helix transcriptional regulator [Mycolicibacterium sp. 050158]MDX1893075.1 helix-turn-helix transcriptional regulator [Mycolicibacterium sp. 050158]